MALQRPRFQIDGEEDGVVAKSIAQSANIDLVNITGPGLIKESSYSLDTDSGGKFSLQRLVITVDGSIIFNKSLDRTESITESGVSGLLGDFQADIPVLNDTFDFTLKDMAFLADFRIQLFNDDPTTWVFDITGATLGHKGV